MKKISALILALALAVCAPACVAEGDGRWYALNDGGTVITVRLDANATTGYAWRCAVTDESILEPVSEAYVPDANPELLDGVGGQYIASFRAVVSADGSAKEGPVSVDLRYGRPSEADSYELAAILDLYVSETGEISVANSLNEAEDDGSNVGCTLDPDGKIMHIRFNCVADPGCAWHWTIDDTDILEEITGQVLPETEGLTAGMSASFFAANTPFKDETPIRAGETFVTVTYGASGEGEVPIFNCVYKVTVAEDGTLTVE